MFSRLLSGDFQLPPRQFMQWHDMFDVIKNTSRSRATIWIPLHGKKDARQPTTGTADGWIKLNTLLMKGALQRVLPMRCREVMKTNNMLMLLWKQKMGQPCPAEVQRDSAMALLVQNVTNVALISKGPLPPNKRLRRETRQWWLPPTHARPLHEDREDDPRRQDERC